MRNGARHQIHVGKDRAVRIGMRRLRRANLLKKYPDARGIAVQNN